MKKLAVVAIAAMLSVAGTNAYAACAYKNETELKMLSAAFEAWKAVTDAMAECGMFSPELDQEFREKQPAAFAAQPSLYHLGGVANSTSVPLVNEGTIRPLGDLVAKYGQHLTPNQLVEIDGEIMAIAMMVNTQHLMYREDIFDDLGLAVPTTYDELIEVAEELQKANVVDYPLGATYKSGWNIAADFVNMFLAFDGQLFDTDLRPMVNSDAGMKTLEMMKRLTAYMDPEYLVSDSTYVQQQFQQGKIAIANLWASRAGAMDDEAESSVVGKVQMAAAPAAMAGGPPASTLWWDGIVVATNITDEEAEAAFQVAMEGIDREMVEANNDAAVWLIDGFEPGRLAQGAAATAANGAPPYPASTQMGLMHTALGNGVSDFLTDTKSAEQTLADIEEAYLTAAREKGLIE